MQNAYILGNDIHKDIYKFKFIAGTTGEGVSLNVAERKQVAEVWKKHSSKLNKILCHVGANSITDVKGEHNTNIYTLGNGIFQN